MNSGKAVKTKRGRAVTVSGTSINAMMTTLNATHGSGSRFFQAA